MAGAKICLAELHTVKSSGRFFTGEITTSGVSQHSFYDNHKQVDTSLSVKRMDFGLRFLVTHTPTQPHSQQKVYTG